MFSDVDSSRRAFEVGVFSLYIYIKKRRKIKSRDFTYINTTPTQLREEFQTEPI
jgi:hypothetical protein